MTLSRRDILAGLGGALAAPALVTPAFAAAAPLSVVATTGMIADTARRVGGDLVKVRALMGPGVDPHSYRQTRTDILALVRSDLVLWNGLYLEAQMEDFLSDLARKTSIVAVGEAVPRAEWVAHDIYVDRVDPHVWMDPNLWRYAIDAVRDAMSDAAPDHAEAFVASAAIYSEEAAAIANYAAGILASVPKEARILVTAHDAFNYFGRAHDFEVVGIQGISTESEAGVNRISTIVDMIVDRKVAAVFVESSVSDRSIRALAEGAAANGHDLKIGGELFSDAMGVPGTYEGTYIGMIDHNATVIATALGGSAPDRGYHGLLSAWS
ncbi:MAG: zinc ABC transporter substrate-binding protein [Boseongicola sp.]